MRRVCIWCQREIAVKLSLTSLLSFKSVKDSLCCSHCLEQFKEIDMHSSCLGCGRQMDKKDWCQDCMRWREIYPEQELHHRALFEYNLFAKEWMERFKFRGDVRIVKMLVPYVAKELKEYKQTHLIVPMPIRTSSLEERGFNQVEVILKEVGIAYCEALKHQLSGKKQSQKNKKERLNSPQPFCWIDGKQEQFFGKRVLVVDDVYTTGRTMLYAVQLLEEAKAERIDTLSIFR